jgi:hypothetical protein
MNTYVNGYIVSTVGEYIPDAPVREVIAQSRKVVLEGQGDDRLADYMNKLGFEDIGYDRKYETMVFKAKKTEDDSCCPYRMDYDAESDELDFDCYNESKDAFKGHYKLCEKYDSK